MEMTLAFHHTYFSSKKKILYIQRITLWYHVNHRKEIIKIKINQPDTNRIVTTVALFPAINRKITFTIPIVFAKQNEKRISLRAGRVDRLARVIRAFFPDRPTQYRRREEIYRIRRRIRRGRKSEEGGGGEGGNRAARISMTNKRAKSPVSKLCSRSPIGFN